MVARRIDAGADDSKPRMPPARTPESREEQMIALAFDAAQKQMENGTASAQVIVHFLKFGSERDKLEREKLRKENLLAEARVDQINSSAHNSELYQEAIRMMGVYTGEHSVDETEF